MIRNYIAIAWRNMSRHKVYTLINVLGLALGLCACIVIFVITHYELSFDRDYAGSGRIYRVMGDVTQGNGERMHFGRIPLGVSLSASRELAGLGAIAGVIPYRSSITVPEGKRPVRHFDSRRDGSTFINTVIAEPEYLGIFPYEFLAGGARTALSAPFTVVLTASQGRRYFGPVSPAVMIGKEVIYDDSLRVRVSGIVKDRLENSDLAFTDLISYSTVQSSFLKNTIHADSWGQGDLSTWTFVKLPEGGRPGPLAEQLRQLGIRHQDPSMHVSLWLEPLSDIHFNADVVENPIRTAHLPSLYGLMGIAVFILILAVINFINLSTAQSLRRSKEVGVRKVLGGSRGGLVLQFLTETGVLCFMAVLLAVGLADPVLAAFRGFIPPGVAFHAGDPAMLVFLGLVTVLTTMLAGFYPAKVLSSYVPALSLKGAIAPGGGGKWWLRKGLIVFQFSVSLVFIIGSIVIASQLRYTRSKQLGFRSDAIITVSTPGGDGLARVALLAETVRHLSGVSKVALQWVSPMTGNGPGRSIKFNSRDEKETGVVQVAGNEDFIPLYEIKLLAGRNLAPADSLREFVINEDLSRAMGCKKPADAIGKTLYWSDTPYPVVGVVADFHSRSLHDPIAPLVIVHRPDRESTLAIKLAAKDASAATIGATLARIEKAWKQVYPGAAFQYQFFDESLHMLYEKDRQTAVLVNTAMGVTIFISCMGLFGLALFMAEKRAKEISIRKILGASIADIAGMLSGEFIRLVILAIFIASPIAWLFMNRWLEGFAYRIAIGAWVFLAAGLSAILIALVTVGWQAMRAARANPVKSLKTE